MARQKKYSRVMLNTTAFFALLSCVPGMAYADPAGGAVTSGTANITASGQTTTITQSTDRAIIRWDSFDIDAAEHVQFQQPSSSSITVNRIQDTKASRIDGKLSANGNIILINPNGMVFGASAVVDVGGLVATSSDLEDDSAFMGGGAVKFTKPGKADAKIINNGAMTVKDGGLVGLVAPNVENNGIIQAKLGKVHLASGDIHTIDFAGDGLIKLEVSEDVYAQSVKNTGTIIADGGEILLTAAAARSIVDTLVTNTGTLRADTVTMPDTTQHTGSITLSTQGLNLSLPHDVTYVETEPTKAQIINTGHISTNGVLYDQVAGSITVLADIITIGDGSVIEASGDVGGGDIRIGGDYQGGNGVPTSDMLYISEQVILNANARRRGNGGRIILWSDENTRFYGHAEATGGLESGNGGLIEISGKKFLDFDGTINLLSAHGASGTLLLDPTNITISSGANANVNGVSPFAPNADDVVSVLNITTLQAALAAGNVIVQTRATGAQAGDITVNSVINWTSGNTLTLDAHNNIVVNQTITAGTGSVTMIAGGDVQFNANISGTGTLTIQQANDAQTMGVAGGAGTLNLSTGDLNRIVDGWSNIVLGRTGGTALITVNARTWTDSVTFRNGAGNITVVGSQTMGANALTFTTNGGILSLGGATGTGTITATTGGGNIILNSTVNTSGAVNLNTGGGSYSNTSSLTSGALTIATAGGALTVGAATAASGITSLNSGGGAMNINAALNTGANALSLTTSGTNITTNGAGIITSGPLTIVTSGGSLSTGAAITASGVTAITTGAGTITLGASIASGTASLGLTTTGAAITTGAITGGAITINSSNANISTGTITATGNSTITSGTGTISIGNITAGTNTFALTSTGFAITTAAITSGALTINSGGAVITTNGNIAASGNTTLNSGGAAININAALGSGTGTLNLTTGGGALTTLAGAITSGAFNISTSGGNVVLGGTVSATGVGSILSGAGTVQTGAISTGANALGITTTAATITTGNLTSGALTLVSGGANIQTGTLSFSGTSSVNAGSGTINIGAVTGGTNAFTLTTAGFNITTAAITSGNLAITSGGGIVATNGAVATTGTSNLNSGGGAINLNAGFTSTSTMTLTSGGGAITKANTGAMSSAALNITTADGNLSIGTGGLTTTGATNINTGAGTVVVNSAWTATNQSIGITTTNAGITLGAVTSAARTLTSNGGNITIGGATNSTSTGTLTINSGGGDVTFTGAGTFSSTTSAINVTTTGGAINKNAAVTSSTGAITMTSGGGAIVIGTGILQSTTSGAITLNSGGGNITVGGGSGIQTATGTISLNSGATGIITVNNIIRLTGAGTLNITTDTDIALNVTDALYGTGATLNVLQFTNSKIIGIGAAAAGDILFSAAEYAMIRDGWATRNFGATTATGGINVTAASWTDSVAFRSQSGVINLVNAMTFAANNLTITTDANVIIGGQLTGTGTLSITPTTNSTTIGIGTSESGDIHFTDAERDYLDNTWANIVIGTTAMTGNINIATASWVDPLILRTNTGVININGAQSMAANALTFNTNADLALNANLSGTGALIISTTASSTTTMGFGDGMAGTLNLTNAELNRIQNGFSGITLGSTSATGTVNIGARTWQDSLAITTNTGVININGAQAMTANNNLTINTNANLVIGANLSGSGTGSLSFAAVTAATTMGIGDGMAGTINFTDAELGFIQNGWASLVFGTTGTTGAMNVGAYTWQDNLFLRTSTGVMSIDGATMGANNLTLSTDGNLAINGAITGTGALTIRASNNGTVSAFGDGQTGTLQVSAAELANIQNGWSSITLGHTALTGATNVGALTWNDAVVFLSNTGVISINGQQDMGTNNLTFTTNGDLTIAAGLAGTGNLTIQSTTNNIDMGIGTGQTGNIQLSNADLGNILNGWGSITFSTTGTGADINLGAYTWQYDTLFRTGAGIITVAGEQTTNQDMTFEANSNVAVNAALTGSGILTFRGQTTSTTMSVATTGGTLIIDATELGRITNGWDQIVFGRADSLAAGTINAAAYTWNDNVRYLSGAGVITVSGAQTMGANDLTISTNANLALNAALTGTGDLVIEGAAAATTIGLAGGAGTLALTAVELNQITDGWGSLTFGSISGTGVVTVAAYTWKDNATFISNGNIAVTGVQSSNASTDVTYVTLAGNFVNSAGATPFSGVGAGGRYLIYSRAAGTDTYGGMTPPTAINSQTYFSQPPSSIGAGLNRIIYSNGAAKILYLQIDDKTKVYGDALPTLTYTYLGGLQGGDLLAAAITAYSLNAAGATATDSVGVLRTISGSFTTGLGYSVQVTDGTLSVTKAPILVSVSNETQAYGDVNPGTTISYTGLRNGETSAVIDTLATASSGTDNLTNVGTYAITVSGAVDNNYTFNYASGTLTINKAVLTATTQNATREYGLANPALSIVYTGFKNGEDESVINTLASASTAATAASNVNTYAITGTGGLDDNYSFTFANTGLLSVTKATLTTTTQNATREYGVVNPALSVVYTGFRNGDDNLDIDTLATVSTLATITSDVGTYDITAAGGIDNNYQFTYVDTGDLSITKAILTATTQNATREYGLANPTFSIVYTGFRNGDDNLDIDTLATGASLATIASNVGTYDITAAGAVDNNYQFTYVDTGDLTITKATLTATTQNATREYGLANPTLSVVYTGFRNGDDDLDIDTLAMATTAATLLSNVGTFDITATGAVDNNYQFTYVDTGDLSVTKATLNATGQAATREYGLANPTLSLVYTGFRNGDDNLDIDTPATAGTTATITSDAGNYNVTGTGGLDDNYTFNYIAGTLSITKATLTATTQNATREYGLANPTFSIVYTGFRNGDDDLDIDTLATGSTLATTTSNVGTYDITATGGLDNNYQFTYVDTGDLSITKATLTATTQNATREYGVANPTLSVVYTGFRNGDDDLDIDTLATASTLATITSNVGAYDITATGGIDNNYQFTYVDSGDLSITKATLTATTQNATREYGLANPTLGVVYTGFRNGDDDLDIDTLATASTLATIASNVGTYDITSAGAVDNNYQFTYTDSGDLSITKATLTATTQNATREYGLANPTFSVVYTGFRNGDDDLDIDTLATASTLATITSNVGAYDITATGGVDNNYQFTYVDTGDLSITKATLSVVADDKYREIGEPDPALTATYTGFRNGDDTLDINTLASLTTTATGASPLGNYVISASGAVDNNYQFTYTNGVFSVVADSGIPPTQPSVTPPAPVLPSSSLPPTVDHSLNSSHYVPTLYYSPFVYSDMGERMTYMGRPDVVFISDDDIFKSASDDYLIAIADSLRREFYGFYSGGDEEEARRGQRESP